MTFLGGLLLGLFLGASFGAVVMAILTVGSMSQMQAELDDCEASRWQQ